MIRPLCLLHCWVVAWLCLLASVGPGTAQVTVKDGSSSDTASIDWPTIYYAAIDVSSEEQGNNNVGQVLIKENGSIIFTYSEDNFYGNQAKSFTVHVCTWSNGSVTNVPTTFDRIENETGSLESSASYWDANTYSIRAGLHSQLFGIKRTDHLRQFLSSSTLVTRRDSTDNWLDLSGTDRGVDPPFDLNDKGDLYSWPTYELLLTSKNGGSMVIKPTQVRFRIDPPEEIRNNIWFVKSAGATTFFADGGDPFGKKGIYHLVPATPEGVNDHGWVIGPSYIWDASKSSIVDLTDPATGGTPKGINNENAVIVHGFGTDDEGFLWEGGNRTYLRDVLPGHLRGQVSNIQPYMLSESSGGSAICILARSSAGNIRCTRDGAGKWSFAKIVLPEGISLKGMRSNGMLVGKGKLQDPETQGAKLAQTNNNPTPTPKPEGAFVLCAVQIDSMDRFLAGSIEQSLVNSFGGNSKFGLVFRHKTTDETYAFSKLSEAYIYDDPYSRGPEGEDKFLSNSEISGQLVNPQLSQSVVFYRQNEKLHFRALFNQPGEIEVAVMVDGKELGKIDWELYGDLEVGHLMETVDTILSGTWGNPPVQSRTQAAGGGGAIVSSLVPSTSFPGYFAARGLTIKVLMPVWDNLGKHFTDGIRKTGAAVNRTLQMAAFGGKGFCEGAWMGVKDDAASIVELGKMILNPAETAKTFREGFKVLMKLDANGWKNVGKTLVKSFLETGQNGVDDWGEPNNLDVAAYLIGYTSGFIAEQIAMTYVTAGILKAGNIGAKIGAFIRNAAKGIFQPLAEAVELVRKQAMMFKNSVFRRFSQDVLSEDDVRKLKILLEELQVGCCPAN